MKLLCAYVVMLATIGVGRADISPKSYAEYKTIIEGVHQKIIDLTSAEDLFGVTNFKALYQNPTRYVSYAKAFLKDKGNTEENKMIVVYSMQRLPVPEYVGLEGELLSWAEQSILSERLANRALFPGSDWSTTLEFAYKEPDVNRLLERLSVSHVVSRSNKEYIKDIISGKAKSDIEELQESGLLPKLGKR